MKKKKVVTLIRHKQDVNHIMNRYLCSEADIKGLSDIAFVCLATDKADDLEDIKSPTDKFYAKQLASRVYYHSLSVAS